MEPLLLPNPLPQFQARQLTLNPEIQRRAYLAIKYAFSIPNSELGNVTNDNLPSGVDFSWPKDTLIVVKYKGVMNFVYAHDDSYGKWAARSGGFSLHVPLPGSRIELTGQYLILLGVAEQLGIATQDLLDDFTQRFHEIRPQVQVASQPVQHIRLAARVDGSMIAQYHQDGWYAPNGEPVGDVRGHYGWVELEF